MQSPNPVKLFDDLSQVVAVTFYEYFMYSHLVDFWLKTKDSLSRETRDNLSLVFTESGQLLVSWEGNRQTRRRLVLVAHVDQEGFLISHFARGDAECHGVPSNDESPFEDEKIG